MRMDEMCQELEMTGVVKNAGRPVWSVEAFHKRWRSRAWCRSSYRIAQFRSEL